MAINGSFASPLANAHYPPGLDAGAGGRLEQLYNGLNGYSLVVTFFLILVAYDQFKYIWNKGSIVGPAWKMPFIGPFLSSVNPKMDEYKAKWASGDLSCVSVFHKFVVIASSRDMARKVFNSPAFVKPCVVDVAYKLLRPTNWVFLDGRAHVDYRKGLNGLFTRQALETYLPGQEEVYEKYFAKFLDISQKENSGKPVPFMPIFRELMCAVSCRTFVGHYMSDAAVKKVADDYYKITAALELVNFPIIIPFTKAYYGKKAADMVLNEFAICAAKSKARMAAGGDITCIMDAWVKSMLDSEKYREKVAKGIKVDDSEKPAMLLRIFSDYEISQTIFTFLFASQDATSSASTWLFQLMADRPEILDRVREENLAVRNGDKHQRFSMDILEKMPYTRAVIKETLRYRPPVIMVPYIAKKSFPVTENYTAPKGSMVIPSVWPALHDPEVYPAPDTFDPERWISGDAGKAVKNWLVFGTGPHYCLGQTYAQLNLMAMIGKASMKLDWKHHVTPRSEDIKVFATIFPMDDCPLIQSLSSHPSPTRLLIDVREPAELEATGRIPSAVSMPITSNPDAIYLSPEDFHDRFGFEKPGNPSVSSSDESDEELGEAVSEGNPKPYAAGHGGADVGVAAEAEEEGDEGGDGVREVVFYCKAGVRSRAAMQMAAGEGGWKGVRVGQWGGGWVEWEQEGGKVER
ncbi:MAG: hypothetical protein Q9166_007176 [cf. Caloplaca sp. 2 TL-2023]